MELVYEFIAHSKCGTPPFEIPKMRYVKVALAIAENNARDTFLLEEVINDDSDGPFVKYIGNGSAVPLCLASPDRAHIAAFLAFAQHVQYEKTKKMVFVADFQGGRTLLTDPQMITHLDTGRNFADGNLASTYEFFCEEHKCNQFCQFYALKRPTRHSSYFPIPLTDDSEPLLRGNISNKQIYSVPVSSIKALSAKDNETNTPVTNIDSTKYPGPALNQ